MRNHSITCRVTAQSDSSRVLFHTIFKKMTSHQKIATGVESLLPCLWLNNQVLSIDDWTTKVCQLMITVQSPTLKLNLTCLHVMEAKYLSPKCTINSLVCTSSPGMNPTLPNFTWKSWFHYVPAQNQSDSIPLYRTTTFQAELIIWWTSARNFEWQICWRDEKVVG